MRVDKGSADYSYWKWSWVKWLVLAAGLLELVQLGMSIREYRYISEAGILSDQAWASFAVQEKLQFVLKGALAACFFGTFLIGALCRSRKQARLAESALLLALALVWTAALIALRPTSSADRFLGALVLCATAGGAGYSFWQYRRKCK